MARVTNVQEALDTFSNQGGAGFFGLKNDKDSAKVRFLHSDVDSLDIVIVHAVDMSGKKRWISCLEEDCPLCKAGNPKVLKIFLQLEDLRDGKRKVWERGKVIIPQIVGYINKYGDLNNRIYEIERHGKSGDNKTTYQFYPSDKDNTPSTIQKEELIGKDKFVLELDYDEMTQLVTDGLTISAQEVSIPNPTTAFNAIIDTF